MITLLQRLFLLTFFLAMFGKSYAKSGEPAENCQGFYVEMLVISEYNGFPISCAGAADGQLQANAFGGTAPYTYSWSNGETTEYLFNLPDGYYTVTVTDSLNCVFEADIPLYAPLPVTHSTSVIHQSTPGVNDGAISMTLYDGVPPYNVNWSNGMTGEMISGLAPGTYSADILDANGCHSSVTEIINPSPCGGLYANSNITSDYNSFAVSCPGMMDGSISAIAQGGIPPYTHAWSSGHNGPDAIGLSDGWHYVTITDSIQCVVIDTIFLAAPPYLMDSIGTANESAPGAMDGYAQLYTSGGVPPYSYVWDNGADSSIVYGLAGGSYQITTTDTNGCTLPSSVFVQTGCEGFYAYPQTISDHNGYPLSCFDSSDAIAEAIPNAGTPPFVYTWSNGDTTPQADSLGAGWTSVTITDYINCAFIDSVYIYEPPALTNTLNTIDQTTGGNDGEIHLAIFEGVPPYTVNWSNGMAGDTIVGLAPGTYTGVITDANGCSLNITGMINPSQSCTGFTDSLSILQTPCPEDYGNGQVEVFPMGGVGPYIYTWNNGATTAFVNGLTPGFYSVTIEDSQSCVITDSFELFLPVDMTVNFTTIDETGTSANGEIIATPYDPNLTFNWSNGMTGNHIIGLAAGTYSVDYIHDIEGCFATAEVVVNNVPADCSNLGSSISVISDFNGFAISCPGMIDGSVEVFPVGGIAPHSFLWSNGHTAPILTGVGEGWHYVTVTDDQNCSVEDSVFMAPPPVLNISFSTVDESASGALDGEINTTVTGGVGPYNYNWSNGMTGAHLIGLYANTYTVDIVDLNGCNITATTVVNVAQGCNGFTDSLALFHAPCPEDYGNGYAQVFPMGGVGPYTYNWNNGATTAYVNGLTPGFYSVTIEDAQTCIITDSFEMFPPVDLGVIFSTIDETGTSANGEIIAIPNDPNLTFNWSNGMTGAHITGLAAGTYTVDYTHIIEGCVGTDVVVVNNIPADCSSFTALLSTSYFGNYHIPCAGESGGYVDAYATGGVSPYTFNWSNGVSGAHNAGLIAGTYTVTITDLQDCELVMDTTLIAPTQLTVVGSGTDESAQGASDGEATVIATGGVEPYVYNWNNGVAGDTIVGLSVGNYTATVTDANDCTAETMVTIVDPCEIFVTTISIVNEVSCLNDGTLSAYATGGVEPYSFNWSNGATAADVTGLSSGLYTLEISDANGCAMMQSIYLGEPNPLAVIVSSTPESTAGDDGTATCYGVGGTMPYQYAWSNAEVGDTIVGLASKDYIVTVTDVLGCTAVAEVFVAVDVASCDGFDLTMAITSNYNGNAISCAGASDGAAMAMVGGGGTPPYSYLWEDGDTTANNTALPMGTFMVTVTDEVDCTVEGLVTIAPPSSIVVFVSSTAETTAGANDGVAYATASGGTGSHTFAWSSGATTGLATGLTPGLYTVTATDANGCFETATVYVDPGEDPDSDQDGFVNSVDNCPTVYNPSQQDDDNDGQGNACTCDPDDAPLPNTSGVHQSAYASYDAGWTHYCNSDGELLLSLALDSTGAEIPDNEVRLEVGQEVVSFYGDTTGFVTNGVGGVFLNRNWDVNPTTQPMTDVNVKYYFHQSDYEALNTALIDLNAPPIPNVTDLRFFKVTNASLGLFPPIPSVPSGNLEMIENGASPTINTWEHGSHGAVDHSAEYLVYSFSGGGGGGAENGGALPVELLYFRASLQGQSARLIWATAIEENNLGFEVQRNVGNEWETIGFVKGEGTTNLEQQYSFVDDNTQPGANYYRLKQLDTDGQFEYTEVRVVQLGEEDAVIAIYPNPTTGNFVVTNVLGKAKIINSFGVVVKEFPIDQPRQTIDVSDLTSGMYYIEFDQGEHNRTTQRFYKATE